MQGAVLGAAGKSVGLQHTASTPRNIWGERTHIEIRKGGEEKTGQCHGTAKSLGSEVKDNYIQITAVVRDFGEGLLTSLSFNFLIYTMAIIIIFAFASNAKPPVGCAGSRQTFLWVSCLYKQLKSPQIGVPTPLW